MFYLFVIASINFTQLYTTKLISVIELELGIFHKKEKELPFLCHLEFLITNLKIILEQYPQEHKHGHYN